MVFSVQVVFSEWQVFPDFKEIKLGYNIQHIRKVDAHNFQFLTYDTNKFQIYNFNSENGQLNESITFNHNLNLNIIASYFDKDRIIIIERKPYLGYPTSKLNAKLIIFDLKEQKFSDSIIISKPPTGCTFREHFKAGEIHYSEKYNSIIFTFSNYVTEDCGKTKWELVLGNWGYAEISKNRIINSKIGDSSYTDLVFADNNAYFYNDYTAEVGKFNLFNRKYEKFNNVKPRQVGDRSYYRKGDLTMISPEKLVYGMQKSFTSLDIDLKEKKTIGLINTDVISLKNFNFSDRGLILGKNQMMYFANLNSISLIDSIHFEKSFNILSSEYLNNGDDIIIGCSDSTIKLINVSEKFKYDSDFTVTDTLIYVNQKIQFFKNVPEDRGEYIWDLDYGLTSNEKSPFVSYPKSGYYTIKLIFQVDGKRFETEKKRYVHVVDEHIPDFTSDVQSGNLPLTVHFKNLTKGENLSYKWFFGDGKVSTEKDPVHTYDSVKSYNVKLQTKDLLTTKIETKYFFINTDSIEIEPIKFNNIIKIPLKCHYEDFYTVPQRAYELRPGEDHIIELLHCSFTNAGLTIQDNNIQKIILKNNEVVEIKNFFNSWIDLREILPIGYNLAANNFYPDSCLDDMGVYNQRLLITNYDQRFKNYSPYNYPFSFDFGVNTNSLGNTFNSTDILIHNFNLQPFDTNLSILQFYSKKDTIVDNKHDISFNNIKNITLDGNLSVLQENRDQFLSSIKTYFGVNKYDLDVVFFDRIGNIYKTVKNISKFNSLFIYDYKKINNDLFVAVGVAGNNLDKGKAYIAKFNGNGELIYEQEIGGINQSFSKILPLSSYEFAVLNRTSSLNKGFYVFNSNLKRIKDYRFSDTTFFLTDIYKTSTNKIKVLGKASNNSIMISSFINMKNSSIDYLNYEEGKSSLLLELENDIPLGIVDKNINKQMENRTNLSISPNPATDYINIKPSEGFEPSEGYIIQIFDILGIEMSSAGGGVNEVYGGGSIRIDISNLSAGVYFIRIGDKVEKFLKM
jgi:hypothetical protein